VVEMTCVSTLARQKRGWRGYHPQLLQGTVKDLIARVQGDGLAKLGQQKNPTNDFYKRRHNG